jgi:hypothetical protein
MRRARHVREDMQHVFRRLKKRKLWLASRGRRLTVYFFQTSIVPLASICGSPLYFARHAERIRMIF